MSLILLKKKYEHYLNINIKIDLNIQNNENYEKYDLYIVYYINCLVNKNYLDWLINQIDIVKNYDSKIYIIATILESNEKEFKKSVLKLFPNVTIECYYENEFEYKGILKVWELGQIYNKTNDIILYFHSKGITHHTNYESNKNDNYNIILKDINKIKEIFTIFQSIDKIGYCSGGIGWIWYNFWYARGSYINKVEKPIKTTRRHYYEDWLGRKIDNNDNSIGDKNFNNYKNTLENCYNFYTNKINIANIGSYYCPNTDEYYNLS